MRYKKIFIFLSNSSNKIYIVKCKLVQSHCQQFSQPSLADKFMLKFNDLIPESDLSLVDVEYVHQFNTI